MTQQTLTLSQINIDPDNVRVDETTNQEELAQSILSTGLIQPIVLDRENTIIAGHRRVGAIKHLIETKMIEPDWPISVVFKDTDEVPALQMMLVENLQRDDLNPVEEARGYDRMRVEYGLNHGDIAERVGRGRTTVSARLRLLKLPEVVLASLSAGYITIEQAEEMIPIADMQTEIDEILLLKLAPQQIRMRVERILRKHQLTAMCELVDRHGAVGVSDFKAMQEFSLEVHINGKSVTNPTEKDIEDFVVHGEVYKVAMSNNGDLVVQETREVAHDPKEDSLNDREKLKRAAKRKRQDLISEVVLTTSIKAADVRPLLNNLIANMLGNSAAKLACRYLGITKNEVPVDKYDDPRWDAAISEALDTNGVQGVRAQVAVIAAFWEQRHGAHMVHLDPNYQVILNMLGVDLDPVTLGPVEEDSDGS